MQVLRKFTIGAKKTGENLYRIFSPNDKQHMVTKDYTGGILKIDLRTPYKRDTRFYDIYVAINYFIDKSIDDNILLNIMKLQKLLYITYGYGLANFGVPIFNETPQAWRYGPIFSSVYNMFIFTKNDHIPDRTLCPYATREVNDKEKRIIVPKINPINEENKSLIQLLESVWVNYGRLDPLRLSSITSKENSPWHKITQKYDGDGFIGDIIDDYIIKEYYLENIINEK